ncbi:methyltransferase domain protein, partial [Vibrio parahaemolyticus V-223/04]
AKVLVFAWVSTRLTCS